MEELSLITEADAQFAKEKLNTFYKDGMIPAEKKTYLTQLENGRGPYMGIETSSGETHYLMDAASQIATLGLGFNPNTFYGTAHHLESWLNNCGTESFQEFRQSFHNFLKRKLVWDKIHTFFCNSGAEANEFALGQAWQYRKSKKAKKVLAFEGSFHGRMMVSLFSTWNKSKREPFQVPGKETVYCPYPELEDDQIYTSIPSKWREFWDDSLRSEFRVPDQYLDEGDQSLKKDTECLLKVREQLITGEIFAIIIEPMQCEGGDRFSSERFHTGLLLMARSFQIPVIYDEVQTGFHLGREFFWHRHFKMHDQNNDPIHPSYVTTAKKSQIGMVLCPCPLNYPFKEEFQVASAIRGYLHGMALDQYQSRIIRLEEEVRPLLNQLVQKFHTSLKRPRAKGMSFAFDLLESKNIPLMVEKRFKHGLLFYQAGSHTLRFRLNTSFRTTDLEFLFDRLHDLCNEVLKNKSTEAPKSLKSTDRKVSQTRLWQQKLLEQKFSHFKVREGKTEGNEIFIRNIFKDDFDMDIEVIDASNFDKYKQEIVSLQENTYEPARQTEINKFQLAAEAEGGLCLAVKRNDEIAAISFSAPIKNFPLERGTRKDPNFSDDNTLYVIDSTVRKKYQGIGLGRNLKYASFLLASERGITRIQGRNRDRLAGSMLSINLSLGAIERFYIKEDYPDFEDHRDVVYYTTLTNWKRPPLSLSDAIQCPVGIDQLSKEFINSQLPYINNKVCLSNFVSQRFLEHVQFFMNQAPKSLKHGYTSSGQSECVDKIAKSIFHQRKNEKAYRFISFENHFFGQGSFASRGLSGIGKETFFETKIFPHPTIDNSFQILEKLQSEFSKGETLAVWIEPLLQKTGDRVPFSFLVDLKMLCEEYSVSLVYNETASGYFRYDQKSYLVSNNKNIVPDACFQFLGGQAGIVYLKKDHFIEKPLMMISTWDGDEFSFANAALALRSIQNDLSSYHQLCDKFQEKVESIVSKYHNVYCELENGVGKIVGQLPHSVEKNFERIGGQLIVLPSMSAMKQFLES